MGDRGRSWRPWPRSIRGCYTLILGLITLLVFTGIGVGVDLTVRRGVSGTAYDQAMQQARLVSDQVRLGDLRNPIAVAVPAADLIQVIDVHGQILAASPEATDRPALSRDRPGPNDRVHHFSGCPWKGAPCVIGVATRASGAENSSVIYVARRQPFLLQSHGLELLIGAIVLFIGAAAAGLTWVLVGRTLKPVRDIQEEITGLGQGPYEPDTFLGRRLSEPPGGGEFAQLARAANATLTRLERSLERQRAFASDASHELRTPIAAMRTQIEAALMFPEDTDMPQTLRAILTDLDRLEAIITDLLLLARLGTEAIGDPEETDLSALVSEELSQREESRVWFHADLEPEVWVAGYPVQLVRLFTNLFDNAQRHADQCVHVTVRREGDSAILEVLDDGEGIAEADRERVFERFTRLDAARSRDAGGSGLGLALVRDIAEVHDGTVTIAPSPRGARFILRIPALPPHAPRPSYVR